MSVPDDSTTAESLWRTLVGLNRQYMTLLSAFAKTNEAGDCLRKGMSGDGSERLTALGVLSQLPADDSKPFLDDLLRLLISPKFKQIAVQLIERLPREWSASRLEDSVGPWFDSLIGFEFAMLLPVIEKIDPSIAVKFARRGLTSSDEDVREQSREHLIEQGFGDDSSN